MRQLSAVDCISSGGPMQVLILSMQGCSSLCCHQAATLRAPNSKQARDAPSPLTSAAGTVLPHHVRRWPMVRSSAYRGFSHLRTSHQMATGQARRARPAMPPIVAPTVVAVELPMLPACCCCCCSCCAAAAPVALLLEAFPN